MTVCKQVCCNDTEVGIYECCGYTLYRNGTAGREHALDWSAGHTQMHTSGLLTLKWMSLPSFTVLLGYSFFSIVWWNKLWAAASNCDIAAAPQHGASTPRASHGATGLFSRGRCRCIPLKSVLSQLWWSISGNGLQQVQWRCWCFAAWWTGTVWVTCAAGGPPALHHRPHVAAATLAVCLMCVCVSACFQCVPMQPCWPESH